MGLTVTEARQNQAGQQRLVSLLLALDNNYPSGGYSLDLRPHGLQLVDGVLFEHAGGYDYQYDPVTRLLHAYTPNGGSTQFAQEESATLETNKRLYTGAVTGTLVVGETISQATSSATGVVAVITATYVELTGITGTFDATHLVTGGTSAATFTPPLTAISLWSLANVPAIIQSVVNNSNAAVTLISPAVTLATGKARANLSVGKTKVIETLLSDAYSALKVTYAYAAVLAGPGAEVAAGTNLSAVTTLRALAFGQ